MKNYRLFSFLISLSMVILLLCLPFDSRYSQKESERMMPEAYYPQQASGQLRLNYYYDRTGRWVKFSDWIPFQKYKFMPRHLEDFYELYGLPHGYQVQNLKENIYLLNQGLARKFRHPSKSLCKIKTQEEFHKYRLLMFMQIHYLIMRSFMRIGSLYDKRLLYQHDLDFADDLELSFQIAKSYYKQAFVFEKQSRIYARQANQYRFILDLPSIESRLFEMKTGKLNFNRIIRRHISKLEKKQAIIEKFLAKEGRPRPVKKAMLKDLKVAPIAPLSPLKFEN